VLLCDVAPLLWGAENPVHPPFSFTHHPCLIRSCSAIGRYDGDVYRELAERAAASPLNSTEEGPAYYPVLRSRIGYGLSKL